MVPTQLEAQQSDVLDDSAAQPVQPTDYPPKLPFLAEPLVGKDDIAEQMLRGIDAYLLQQIDQSIVQRAAIWREYTNVVLQSKRLMANQDKAQETGSQSKVLNKKEWKDESGHQLSPAMESWIALRRTELALCVGLRDERLPPSDIEILQTTRHSGVIGKGSLFTTADSQARESSVNSILWQARAVRWPVLEGVSAEGILIEPIGISPTANIVAIPDADQTPEQIVGLDTGVPESQQTARILASTGCRVLIPTLVNRSIAARGPPGEPGRAELTNREFVYRPAYELGRHIIGYEVQKVLAAVDWLSQVSNGPDRLLADDPNKSTQPDIAASQPEQRLALGVVGTGEGGGIALLCGALDNRVDMTFVKGAFGPRETMWREPICRNLFGFLKHFGDAELAAMIWPRSLVVDFAPSPQFTVKTRGGAPGELTPYSIAQATSEFQRAANIVGVDIQPVAKEALTSEDNSHSPSAAVLCGPLTQGQAHWLYSLQKIRQTADETTPFVLSEWDCVPEVFKPLLWPESLPPVNPVDPISDPASRQIRQVAQLIEHTQLALNESSRNRQLVIQSLDTSSLEKYRKSTEPHRKRFYQEVIGQFDEPLLPIRARSRQEWQTATWTGHEVVLDVWPGIIAYGVLLLPNDLVAGEKRPVVVCQHGLEGRPTDVFLGDHPAYHDFAAKLCERGYIVFAPQNPYLMEDRFRTLQRKANSIGKTLFSIIIPQHQQILNWLKTLPNVDSSRIAFYGLSYGGKSAMRIPAVLQDYCLSICSADFNEWIVKNASTTDSFSYVWTGEYEIFEYNLGNTFGYAEMASLICPRPFMVERGHFDAVAIDQWVGYEYAKVLNLYQARLGIGNLTEIEWFAGPHTIHGKGTFDFLDRHLQFTPR